MAFLKTVSRARLRPPRARIVNRMDVRRERDVPREHGNVARDAEHETGGRLVLGQKPRDPGMRGHEPRKRRVRVDDGPPGFRLPPDQVRGSARQVG